MVERQMSVLHFRNAMESRTVDLALRVLLALGAGVLLGIMALNVPLMPSNRSAVAVDASAAAPLLSILNSLLNWQVLLLILVTGTAAALYSWRAANQGAVAVNMRSLANSFLYLTAIGLFVPAWPIRVTILLAVGAAAISQRTETDQRWGRFWMLFVVAVVFVVAGPVLAPVLGDDIRAEIPDGAQINGALPYAVAFAVAFCVKRLEWGVREFEKFFKVVGVGVAVLIVEASLTFFIGRASAFPGLASAIASGGHFQSSIVGDHHTVARLAMTGLFISLVLFVKGAGRIYVLYAVGSALLLGATLDRAPWVATVIGIGGFLVFGFGRFRRASGQLSTVPIAVIGLLVPILIGGFLVLDQITETRVSRTSANSALVTLQNRSFHLARAADVLTYNPLFGTGPHLDQSYTGSGQIPPVLVLATATLLDVDPVWAISRVSRNELFGYEESRGYGLHNLWMGVLLHWGVLLGGGGLIYLVSRGLRGVLLLRGVGHSPPARAGWLALLFAISLSLSVLTTSGFLDYWFFVIVFYYAASSVRAATDYAAVAG